MEDEFNLQVLKEKIKAKEYIDKKFFNIFNKIENSNSINPLFVHILKLGLNKYNNMGKCPDIYSVGFDKFPGLTIKEKRRNQLVFNSDDAFVFYVSYNEDLISKFYSEKQSLQELLNTNEFKTYIDNENWPSDLKLDNLDNISIKFDSFVPNEAEEVKNEFFHNKAYLSLLSGHNFEVNCITFLLNGLKKIKYLPRVVFYPIIKDIDMEEIDSAFIVKDLIDKPKDYFHNFQSVDFKSNTSLKRNEIVIKKNDLIFVEIVFCHPSKEKLKEFMEKIIKFLKLYDNANIINITEYSVRPILIFDDNYVLKINEYNILKNALIEFKNSNKNFIKVDEIVDNMQICYIWPTLSIYNKFVTTNELKSKIDTQQKQIYFLGIILFILYILIIIIIFKKLKF